jgi:acyl dehydratase
MTATRQPARRVGIDELPALLGQTLGPSAPLLITQDRIDEFAAATGDQQWLHVDAGRAAAGPFGTTIAHGYLTLSLFTTMLWSLLEVPDAAQVINYGLGKVRFPASVPAGCELSLTAREAVTQVADGHQLTFAGTFTRSGTYRPACVLEAIFRSTRPGPADVAGLGRADRRTRGNSDDIS